MRLVPDFEKLHDTEGSPVDFQEAEGLVPQGASLWRLLLFKGHQLYLSLPFLAAYLLYVMIYCIYALESLLVVDPFPFYVLRG